MTEVLPSPVGKSIASGMSPRCKWSNSLSCHRIGLWPVMAQNAVSKSGLTVADGDI